MGKIAFVFSGQGDQYPGMGKELYEQYEAAEKVFSLCDRLRPGTLKQCFSGTEEELRKTVNTQPCLYAMELSAAHVLLEKGIRPDGAAGFSLGEVSAAALCGVFDIPTGFRLVMKRGEFMQKEAAKHDTFMAAVLRLDAEALLEICGRYSGVYAVNFNCPGQITVSGLASQMEEFSADIRAQGGRMIPLKVSGAFHSPFMKEAALAFEKELSAAQLSKPALPLYSDLTAKPYEGDPVSLLSSQICNPVQWEALIRNMISDGMDQFIEIGPGKTLTNMIRKIDPSVKACTIQEYMEETGC